MEHVVGTLLLAQASWWDASMTWLHQNLTWWLVFGLFGQSLFFARFMHQWIASERAGKSIIPTWFWFLSIGGSLILLVYAIHQREPVFVLGYSFNTIPYIRNLMLLHKEKKAKQSGAA